MFFRDGFTQFLSKRLTGSLLPMLACLVLTAACVDVSDLPFVSGSEDEEVSLTIEPAVTSVHPSGEVPLVISVNKKDGTPVKDGTIVSLQNDSLGTVVPTATTTIGGKAHAKFMAGTAHGSATIKAESDGGANHQVTVKIDPAAAPPAPPSNGSPQDEIPAGSIAWAEADISGWKVTSTITSLSVSTESRRVTLTTTKKDWPQLAYPSGPGGMGNWWMIAKVDGKWHAATYEWLGAGRTQSGFPQQFDPTKTDPKRLRGGLSRWVPKKGETVGFCQSTFARDSKRTTNERTNIKTVSWPAW